MLRGNDNYERGMWRFGNLFKRCRKRWFSTDTCLGLSVLQHRGEESCGIAIKNTVKHIKGSYSLIIMSSQKLIAVRDAN